MGSRLIIDCPIIYKGIHILTTTSLNMYSVLKPQDLVGLSVINQWKYEHWHHSICDVFSSWCNMKKTNLHWILIRLARLILWVVQWKCSWVQDDEVQLYIENLFYMSSPSCLSWIYNYLYNQCLSPLKLCIRIPLVPRCTRCNIMW